MNLAILIGYQKDLNFLKIDINKCDHFLKFYFSNGLLQDVACGTTKLKYTTGKLK